MILDEFTLKRLTAGDKKAFAVFYQKTSSVVYSAILKICRDSMNAEDLLHDTYIIAYKRIVDLNCEDNHLAWIKRIAFNLTINFINKQSRLIAIDNHSATTLEQTATLDNVEHENRLEYLMSRVCMRDRLILWLYVAEGCAHSEIGLLFNKSESFSKTIVSRSLNILRQRKEVKDGTFA